MRLVLLTAAEKKFSSEIQKKTTIEREKNQRSTGSNRKRKRDAHSDKKRKNKEEEKTATPTGGGSENYSQEISLEHPPRCRAEAE